MNRHNPDTPPPTTVPPSPAEIIEAHPVPRKCLVVMIQVEPGIDPARVVVSAARFIAAVQSADRWLRLTVDPIPTRSVGGEVTLSFTPARHGIEVGERLEKLVDIVHDAAAAFEGATLSRVEVVTRD